MSSKQSVVAFLVEQMAGAGPVSARQMFGEYAIYCGTKLVALVCDDELFLKPTNAGAGVLGELDERPPYPGAKPYYWISGDRWDDREWLAELVRVTAAELPVPPPKKPRSKLPAKPAKPAKRKKAAKPAKAAKPRTRAKAGERKALASPKRRVRKRARIE